MTTIFRDAVRRSFTTKLGIYLQTGLRDMSIPLMFNEGVVDFTYNNIVFGVVPRSSGEDLFFPGVNILYLDEADASGGRTSKKRYILPVKILITREISGNTSASQISVDVIGVTQLILQALSDGHVDIWDYTLPVPAFTGIIGSFNHTGYRITDESLALPGGDIRHSVTVFVNYADPSF